MNTLTGSRSPRRSGRSMMDRNAAMNLVVQSDFAVAFVLAAGKLHAIHAKIASGEPRLVGVFGIDLRQGDVGAAIVGP